MRLLRPLRNALFAWRRLGPLLGDSWPQVVVLAGASALTGVLEAALLGVITAVALSLSAGEGAAEISLGPASLRAAVGTLLAVGALLAGIRLLLQIVVAWLPARIAADVQARLRREIFDAYVRAQWPVQAAEREGHLQDLMTVHTWRAALAVVTVTSGLGAFVTLAALLVAAFAISAGTAALLLALAGGLFLLLRPFATLQQRLGRRVSATGLDLAAVVTEASRMAEEHHVFGTGVEQARAVAAHIEAHREPFFRTQFIGRLAPSAYQSVAILLLVAGLAVLAALPTPDLAILGTVVLIFVRSLSYGQQVQSVYTHLNELLPFADRVREAVAQFRNHAVPAGTTCLTGIDEIALEGVGFAYQRGRPVLEGVSVRLAAGRAVAVVGPSGAGKSTLVQLLLRVRRPGEGRVVVNGFPGEEVLWQDWQRLVAYVPQDPKLIRGTVADNIRFFRDIPREEVEVAARAAHIHEEILSELGGYDAVIDHRGDTVSGGQRQRICLARALAARPELLVLDEPTSALDARSEALILETLRELRGEMAIVVVAHRPAVVEVCDEVWEVQGRRVAAQFATTLAPVVTRRRRAT